MSRKPYPTDPSDAQWERVRSAVPGAKNGRSCTPRRYPLLTVFADADCRGRLEEGTFDEHALKLVIVLRPEGQGSFVVLPKRLIAERSFLWLMRSRRLRAESETKTARSRAWIYLAAIHRTARRLAQ